MGQFLAFVPSQEYDSPARCGLCEAVIPRDIPSHCGHFFPRDSPFYCGHGFGPQERTYLGILEADVFCSGCYNELFARMKACADKVREDRE